MYCTNITRKSSKKIDINVLIIILFEMSKHSIFIKRRKNFRVFIILLS